MGNEAEIQRRTEQAQERHGCSAIEGMKFTSPQQLYKDFQAMKSQNNVNQAANHDSLNYLGTYLTKTSQVELVSGRGLLGIPIASVNFDSNGKYLDKTCKDF